MRVNINRDYRKTWQFSKSFFRKNKKWIIEGALKYHNVANVKTANEKGLHWRSTVHIGLIEKLYTFFDLPSKKRIKINPKHLLITMLKSCKGILRTHTSKWIRRSCRVILKKCSRHYEDFLKAPFQVFKARGPSHSISVGT